jgi:sugar-specific transcriptional regulator TrmB
MNIGFTEYEARVYDVLINGGLMSANEITRHSGVQRGRVYDVLKSLMDRGLCEMILGTVKKYHALEPQQSFKKVLEEHIEKEKRIRDLIAGLQVINESTKSIISELDFVSIYTSVSAINHKTIEFTEKSKDIIRALCKPPYLYIRTVDELKEKAKPQLEALERGCKFHCIYEIEEVNKENFLNSCSFFQEHGEVVRVMHKLPLKLTIMDSDSSMFTLFHKSLTKNNITSMYIKNSDIVYAFIDLFEYYWMKAIPFDEYKQSLL